MTDSIFAQSSAPGRCGVSLFRISGPKSYSVLSLLCRNFLSAKPRILYFKKFYIPNTEDILDEGMFCYFKAPNSFTGEDVVELYLHGSIAIAKILTSIVLAISGIRLAEPGEFTKRAVLNGKINLLNAEGLSDLINAETEMQQKQAIKQYSGELENLYSSWREKLLKTLVLLEAYIDFPDENLNCEFDKVKLLVDSLIVDISKHLDDNRRGERLRNGILVSILGPPNVGKSSLINYLTQRDVSIISNEPGTTRDVIESYVDLGGYPVIFADTAGIREDIENSIEQIGISKAKAISRRSDLRILVFDPKLMSYENFVEFIDEFTIIVINKIDLFPQLSLDKNFLQISLLKKIGLEQFTEKLIQKIKNLISYSGPTITRVRYRISLTAALKALNRFMANHTDDLVLLVEDLRIASRHLSILLGKIEVEQILDEIFSNFCIGK